MSDIKLTGIDVSGTFVGEWNDFSFTGTQDLEIVEGADYTKQKVTKILLTPMGSNTNFPGYGTRLQSAIHGDLDNTLVQGQIVDAILNAITYLETLETSTNPAERITAIEDVDVLASAAQTAIFVDLTLRLSTNEILEIILGDRL